jgi:hypothetical protein
MGFNITELKASYTIDLALALGSCKGSDFLFFEGISFSCRLTLQLDLSTFQWHLNDNCVKGVDNQFRFLSYCSSINTETKIQTFLSDLRSGK